MDEDSGGRCGRLILFDLGIEDADESARVALEEPQELRSQRLEGRKIGDLRKIRSGHDFLVQHADLHLQFLLLLEELLEGLGDASGVLTSNNNRGRTRQS